MGISLPPLPMSEIETGDFAAYFIQLDLLPPGLCDVLTGFQSASLFYRCGRWLGGSLSEAVFSRFGAVLVTTCVSPGQRAQGQHLGFIIESTVR